MTAPCPGEEPIGSRDPEPDHHYTFNEFRTHGLLWLINTSVFHPRGYALAFTYADGETEPNGWQVVGDGAERWAFSEEGWPEGWHPDDAFRAVRELLP